MLFLVVLVFLATGGINMIVTCTSALSILYVMRIE